MSKVCVTELLQRIGRVGAATLGPDVLTAPGWFGGPLPEWFAYEVVERLHPTLSVGRQRDPTHDDRRRGPGPSARAARLIDEPNRGNDDVPSGGMVDRRRRTAGDPGDRPAARPRAGRRVGAQRGEGRRRRGHAGGHRPARASPPPPTPTRSWPRSPTASATRPRARQLDAAAVPDMVRMLEAGINVVTVSTPGLVHPAGYQPEWRAQLEAAAARGGATLYASGIEPGFAGDQLPLTLMTMSDTVSSVRTQEIFLYDEYPVTFVMFEVFGFGKPMEHQAIMAMPGRAVGHVGPAGAHDRRSARRRARRDPRDLREGRHPAHARGRGGHDRGGHRRRGALRDHRRRQRTRRDRHRARQPHGRRTSRPSGRPRRATAPTASRSRATPTSRASSPSASRRPPATTAWSPPPCAS